MTTDLETRLRDALVTRGDAPVVDTTGGWADVMARLAPDVEERTGRRLLPAAAVVLAVLGLAAGLATVRARDGQTVRIAAPPTFDVWSVNADAVALYPATSDAELEALAEAGDTRIRSAEAVARAYFFDRLGREVEISSVCDRRCDSVPIKTFVVGHRDEERDSDDFSGVTTDADASVTVARLAVGDRRVWAVTGSNDVGLVHVVRPPSNGEPLRFAMDAFALGRASITVRPLPVAGASPPTIVERDLVLGLQIVTVPAAPVAPEYLIDFRIEGPRLGLSTVRVVAGQEGCVGSHREKRCERGAALEPEPLDDVVRWFGTTALAPSDRSTATRFGERDLKPTARTRVDRMVVDFGEPARPLHLIGTRRAGPVGEGGDAVVRGGGASVRRSGSAVVLVWGETPGGRHVEWQLSAPLGGYDVDELVAIANGLVEHSPAAPQ